MADLKGTQVAAAIVPFTDLDTYATHDAEYGKGGFRSVDTNAKRDAIPAARKVKGMVVRVNDTGLHWTWTGSAWAEWLPKGSMLVDATLSTSSTNPVQNKVITAKTQEIEVSVANLATIVNKIPIVTVDTVWNATSNNPASSKAIDSAISPIRTTANSANAKADSALATANAAIPKSYIDTALGDIPLDTRVPSTKLLHTASVTLIAAIQKAQSSADSAYNKANAAIPKSNIISVINSDNNKSTTLVTSPKAVYDLLIDNNNNVTSLIDAVSNAAQSALKLAGDAIPKSKIDTGIDGTETAHDAVPSVGAVVTYVKSQKTAINGSINAVSGRVSTLETWKNGIGNKNQANGVAGLDANGKISASQLPAGYDNVDKLVAFVTTNPSSGMTIGQKWYNTTTKKIFTATSATSGSVSDPIGNDMIYIDQNANKSYYWTGTDMVNIGSGNALALGTTSSTAFRGDYGNTLYTNFGSPQWLPSMIAGRDFFASIANPATEGFLSKLFVTPDVSKVLLSYDIKFLDGNTSIGDVIIPAVTTSKSGVMTSSMYQMLQEIELATFPLDLQLAGGGTWEVGSSVKPVVSITALRKGSDITSSCDIVVTPQPSLSGSLSSNKKTWTASTNISSVYNIQVKATLNTQSITKSVIYYFKYKKYYGTSANATLTNAQILALGGDAWADSRAMKATNFDCTGGKYPYYVIPADIYTGLEVWVGGLKNSDITVTNITLTNDEGASKAYKVVRLTNIQTGILSIQFK